MPNLEYHNADPAERSIAVVEDFLSLVDTGRLFTATNETHFRAIREKTAAALNRLLVWERPELEATKGIAWPYTELRKRYDAFRDPAESNGETDPIGRQAQLFLAFLPFPMQWIWMLRVEERFGSEPEVKDFLAFEAEKIRGKIAEKPQKTYKMRHFCQVLKRFESPEAKGVLRIFSLPYLFADRRILSQISHRYVLYVEPPMGVIFRHHWLRYFSTPEDPVLFGLASDEDASFAARQPNVETTPLAHGDFLEDLEWTDPGKPREYDIVFNSTFDDMPRKRHELMLRLLHHPLLSRTRALFLGRGLEVNVDGFRAMVRQFGLEERVAVRANLQRSKIPFELDKCKIGVHLSLYESGCRAIYEFFRSNLPCVIASSMAGMNLRIFNPDTGMAVRDDQLPEAISFVLANRDSFEPRRWFVSRSGSANSTLSLNQTLKALFLKRGYSWHEDIAPLGSSGADRYVSDNDRQRFKTDFTWLLNCFESLGYAQVKFSVD
jgi:hypothetical protein